jgi:protein-disulfide isomerase
MNAHAPHLTLPVSADRDHIRGSLDAPVILVEYGDYQCPHCGAAYPEVEQARAHMGKRLAFVYRHIPLTNAHPRAQPAAEAGEAAGSQQKFWAMHDMLFEHQDALEDDDLLAYASVIRLDVQRFVRELATGIHTPKVREDFMSGVRSGVNGTPTFFINGVRHNGPYDAAALVAAIEIQATAAHRR